MCRKNHLRGSLLLGFGLGLLIGKCLESWLLCTCGGLCLLILGICILGRK